MDVTDVFGIPLGGRPGAGAFQAGGELAVERGRRAGTRWEPFKAPVFFPLDPDRCTFAYPPDVPGFVFRNLNAHYTPVSRRLDFAEVWDYFSPLRVSEAVLRAQALGLLARAVARRFPDGSVQARARFVRYTEQYVVVTRVASAALERQAAREYGTDRA